MVSSSVAGGGLRTDASDVLRAGLEGRGSWAAGQLVEAAFVVAWRTCASREPGCQSVQPWRRFAETWLERNIKEKSGKGV